MRASRTASAASRCLRSVISGLSFSTASVEADLHDQAAESLREILIEAREPLRKTGPFSKTEASQLRILLLQDLHPLGGEGSKRTTLKYVGPTDDPEIAERAEAFQRAKIGYRARRELAAKLRRAGYPAFPPWKVSSSTNSRARDFSRFAPRSSVRWPIRHTAA